jgi:hypothetical protein
MAQRIKYMHTLHLQLTLQDPWSRQRYSLYGTNGARIQRSVDIHRHQVFSAILPEC